MVRLIQEIRILPPTPFLKLVFLIYFVQVIFLVLLQKRLLDQSILGYY